MNNATVTRGNCMKLKVLRLSTFNFMQLLFVTVALFISN